MVKVAEEYTPADMSIFLTQLNVLHESLEHDVEVMTRAYDAMRSQAGSYRMKSPFGAPSADDDDDERKKAGSLSNGSNFVHFMLQVARGCLEMVNMLKTTAEELEVKPEFICLGDRQVPTTSKDLQEFSLVVDLNSGRIQDFMTSVITSHTVPKGVLEVAKGFAKQMEGYHQILTRRHTVGGIEVHGDPIRTDLAMCLYENVDGNGEIEGGKKANEVSAYAINKATLLADILQDPFLRQFVDYPGMVADFIAGFLQDFWKMSLAIAATTEDSAKRLRQLLRQGTLRAPMQYEFDQVIKSIKDLDFNRIEAKDKTGLLSAEEKLEQEFRNETLSILADMLGNTKAEEIVAYVLDRKEQWHIRQRDENSFYVCKIGAGNPFGGEAPGMLEVIPGIRPKVNLDDILGSGFEEAKAMIASARDSSKWSDLYMATSPSRKVDKTNVLLVGPMGCGKTEILRALGSDQKSIGIFAQASDFLTCWKGEAEKNPKRLFEAGLKLQRESQRQVFFLIDEIDTILNGDRGQAAFGGTNLATEFQILMDGITSYPNLAVWGATNHPERIPMPLLRRFAKVIVVGELGHKDRMALLQRFLSFLPLSKNFNDEAWIDASKILDGAVGDTVRKVTDHIWRSKMHAFTSKHTAEAEKVVAFLQEGGTTFDAGSMTPHLREKLHTMMRPFVEVRPGDLLEAASIYLDNPAIKQEIRTAVDTYKAAREHLVGMVAPRAI